MHWFLLAVLAQQTTQLSSHSRTFTRRQALDVLGSPRVSWEQRSAALDALGNDALTPAQIEKLETAAAPLSRTPPPRCKPSGCGVTIDECLSPAGYVLAAVEGRREAAAFRELATTVLDEKQDTRAMALARRIVAAAKLARAEEEARRLLATNDSSCVGEGALMLQSFETLSAESRAVIERAAQDPANGHMLGGLLATRDEEWARALVVRFLARADGSLRLGVIRGLTVKFPSDEPRRRALATVAWCDAARMQREAKAAFVRAKVELPKQSCAPMRWTVKGTSLLGPDRRTATLTTASNVPAPNAACLEVAKKKDLRALGMVDEQCVLGADHGEFGGELFGLDASGQLRSLSGHQSGINPVAVLRRGPEIIVLHSLAHMMGSGGLGRLEKTEVGLRHQPFLAFTGLPTEWAVDGDQLFVRFRRDEFSAPCEADEGATWVIEPDRTFSFAAGPATACLPVK